jgi:hypothetical protein
MCQSNCIKKTATKIHVFVDSNENVVEFFPNKITVEDVLAYKKYREKLYGPLTLKEAYVSIGQEISQIQTFQVVENAQTNT